MVVRVRARGANPDNAQKTTDNAINMRPALHVQIPQHTQQTQNWCGIHPEATAGHIMGTGWHRDGAVTSSAVDSMG